jgi:hypothetical protein
VGDCFFVVVDVVSPGALCVLHVVYHLDRGVFRARVPVAVSFVSTLVQMRQSWRSGLLVVGHFSFEYDVSHSLGCGYVASGLVMTSRSISVPAIVVKSAIKVTWSQSRHRLIASSFWVE